MTDGLEWQIGKARIRNLVEVDAGSVIEMILPQATPEAVREIGWLVPHFADSDGHLRAVVQSFLIESDGQRILVDGCVGNGKRRKELEAWDNLHTTYLNDLANLGWSPESVTIVMCTHLHFDHVGWNTTWDGTRWVPTFPNARYLFAQQEYDYWASAPDAEIEDDHAGFEDSVIPIVEAGLAEFVPTDYAVTAHLKIFPTPGHTPAHVSVWIESNSNVAVITGDAVHHPCQIAHPDWATQSDTYPDRCRESRLKLFESIVDANTLLLGSHFSGPVGGRLTREGDAFRLVI